MFKFGFSHSDDEEIADSRPETKTWYDAEEIIPELSKYHKIEDLNIQYFNCNDITLKYVSPDAVLSELSAEGNSCVLKAETDHSDLLTAEYEGGLKIWECTHDLMRYLSEKKIEFTNKTVLDLGCGAGILGLFAFLNGSVVHFQDYNKEVIVHTTIPNIILNLSDDTSLNTCKFYSGDWTSFLKLTKIKYDIILTSETIYNPENYTKLILLFKEMLETDGIIYLAAKTYYFGVGGGTRQFEEMLKKSGFIVEVVWKLLDGVQREILKIHKT